MLPQPKHPTQEQVTVPAEWASGRIIRAVRVNGDCMSGETGIADGDIVIIEEQRVAYPGDVVCVTLPERGGVTLIKRYWLDGDRIILRPDLGEPVVIEPDEPLIMEGIVRLCIQQVGRRAVPDS